MPRGYTRGQLHNLPMSKFWGSAPSRVSAAGDPVWSLDSASGPAAVMPDGGVVIGRSEMERRAPDGTLIWRRAWLGGTVPTTVNADRDGRLLVSFRGWASVVSAAGDSLATFAPSSLPQCGLVRGLFPGPNGEVLSFAAPPPRSAGGCIVWRDAATGMVRRTYVAGELRLEFDAGEHVAIGADGTVYVGLDNGAVVAIGGDGEERWWAGPREAVCRYRRADEPPRSARAPALGADGTIFHHAAGRLTAVAPDGSIMWTATTSDDEVADGCYLETSAPLLTQDGRVLVVADSRLLAFAAGTVADSTALWGQADGGPSRGRGPR